MSTFHTAPHITPPPVLIRFLGFYARRRLVRVTSTEPGRRSARRSRFVFSLLSQGKELSTSLGDIRNSGDHGDSQALVTECPPRHGSEICLLDQMFIPSGANKRWRGGGRPIATRERIVNRCSRVGGGGGARVARLAAIRWGCLFPHDVLAIYWPSGGKVIRTRKKAQKQTCIVLCFCYTSPRNLCIYAGVCDGTNHLCARECSSASAKPVLTPGLQDFKWLSPDEV